jgi:hypothetical protein
MSQSRLTDSQTFQVSDFVSRLRLRSARKSRESVMNFTTFIQSFRDIKPLSNFEIIDICKRLKIPHFKGVFMRDELKGKPGKKECLVLNIDHSSNAGTHWTCLFVENNKCFYFDSYGFPPPLEVVKYWQNVKNRYYSTFRVQSFEGNQIFTKNLVSELNRVGCGHYCIYVLHKLSNGHNFYNIIDELCRYK